MNKINYDKKMQKAMNKIPVGTKLLLHVCCAPCATYCLTRLVHHFDVTLYYANDNIDTKDEWQKRLDELYKLVDLVNDGKYEVVPSYPVKLVVKDYNGEHFAMWARHFADQPEGEYRCTRCFAMRLGEAHEYARKNGFDYFATTLTVSQYKNSEMLNLVGYEIDKEGGAKWLPTDFKKNDGYHTSVTLSNKYGLYRQHYCGCKYSKVGEE